MIGGLHAARAVGLHPAVLGEGEALELLAEILDHVVALELAVHQHVEADLLLDADGILGLLLEERLVGGSLELALAVRGARLRTSAVCGNEPMVVVGNGGRSSRGALRLAPRLERTDAR